MNTINGKDLAEFAGDEINLWRQLIGTNVNDAKSGDGKIILVKKGLTSIPLIEVNFNGHISCFPPSAFRSGNIVVFVDDSLPLQLVELASERAKRQNLIDLERRESIELLHHRLLKYSIPFEVDLECTRISPMATILEKIENHKLPSDQEFDWLKNCVPSLDEFIRGISCLVKFRLNLGIWDLVEACSFFRKAGHSKITVDLTTRMDFGAVTDRRAYSALLTTRGAAFRDLGDIEAAKQLAAEAMQVSPHDYEPHNLMGAIFHQLGKIDERDHHFETAKRLGAPLLAGAESGRG